MTFIFTGMGGLRKIDSLLKSGVNSTRAPLGKGEKTLAPGGVDPTSKPKKIVASEIRVENKVLVTGDKDKNIRDLIQKRLLCEEALRLKQEIKKFSSVRFSRLS